MTAHINDWSFGNYIRIFSSRNKGLDEDEIMKGITEKNNKL